MPSSSRTSRLALLAPLALVFALPVAPMAHAADATINEVYQAARAGQTDKALDLMGPVLKDHPNSAKAHYVEAELLAHAGRISEARAELATAEKLAPGLPFASAASVSSLRAQLAGRPGTAPVAAVAAPAPAREGGFPWWGWLVGGGLLFGLLSLLRGRRQQTVAMGGGYNPSGGYAPGGYPPAGGPYGGPGYGAPQGGMGSGIMGGLAQGAAMGAGFAAGERVIDGLFGDHERERVVEREAPQQDWSGNQNQDMGGNDFGISDDSSWDDGGNSGDGGW